MENIGFKQSVSMPTKRPHSYHESILLILWGWIMSLDYFRFYICKKAMVSYDVRMGLVYLSGIVVGIGVLFSLYYLSKRLGKLRVQPGSSLLITWISAMLFMGMIVVIQKNTMDHLVFELQHALFMIVTGTAICITGHLIQARNVFLGGLLFVVLGFVASYLKLVDQLLLESIGWMVAFVIPGHLLYRSASKASKVQKSI